MYVHIYIYTYMYIHVLYYDSAIIIGGLGDKHAVVRMDTASAARDANGLPGADNSILYVMCVYVYIYIYICM